MKWVTNDLLVPAHAEIVLEGYVRLDETRWEGPFGDHTGYYSLADDFPVFHVEAITMRRDAIYPTTIVGRPPMEDCYMGKATERIFLPVIKAMMPEVVDYDLPLEGVFHNCAIFQIRKEFAGQAFRVMNFAWSMGQMMFTKFVIVVDEDVDCHDYSQVAWRCFNNVDPSRDILITKGPLDRLDHSSNFESFGFKMGIDATRPLPGEGHEREWPEALEMGPRSRRASTPCGASSGLSRVAEKTRVFLELVKFEHSVFALPYAYIGALYGAATVAASSATGARVTRSDSALCSYPWVTAGGWPTWAAIVWITVAMVGARSFAFVVNRAVDKEIDARNPRTAGARYPRGSSRRGSCGCSPLSCSPRTCSRSGSSRRSRTGCGRFRSRRSSIYPYTKRFTSLCHYWLGLCLGLAPVGAGSRWARRDPRPAPWVLGAGGAAVDGGLRHHLRDPGHRMRRARQHPHHARGLRHRAALGQTRIDHALTVLLLLRGAISAAPVGRGTWAWRSRPRCCSTRTRSSRPTTCRA